jgi:hypothetical protein
VDVWWWASVIFRLELDVAAYRTSLSVFRWPS